MIKEGNRGKKEKENKRGRECKEESSDSFRVEDCFGRAIETTISAYLSTRRHIPEDLNF